MGGGRTGGDGKETIRAMLAKEPSMDSSSSEESMNSSEEIADELSQPAREGRINFRKGITKNKEARMRTKQGERPTSVDNDSDASADSEEDLPQTPRQEYDDENLVEGEEAGQRREGTPAFDSEVESSVLHSMREASLPGVETSTTKLRFNIETPLLLLPRNEEDSPALTPTAPAALFARVETEKLLIAGTPSLVVRTSSLPSQQASTSTPQEENDKMEIDGPPWMTWLVPRLEVLHHALPAYLKVEWRKSAVGESQRLIIFITNTEFPDHQNRLVVVVRDGLVSFCGMGRKPDGVVPELLSRREMAMREAEDAQEGKKEKEKKREPVRGWWVWLARLREITDMRVHEMEEAIREILEEMCAIVGGVGV